MGAVSQSAKSVSRLNDLLQPEADAIWNCIYSGLSVRKTADKLGYTFAALESWLYEPSRLLLLNRARVSLASDLAHQTITIADGPWGIEHRIDLAPDTKNGRDTANGQQAETFPDAARDKLRIQARQWLASKWDKDIYASSPSTVINVDAKSLHIDSLRKSSNDLQAGGRLNAAHNLPPVQLVDNTASLNATPAAVDPPVSPLRPAPWRGGTPSLAEGLQRKVGVSGAEEADRSASTTEGVTEEEEFAGEGSS
jgi:hypothetical protein